MTACHRKVEVCRQRSFQVVMTQSIFLLPSLLDQFDDSSIGLFSLVGCYFTADSSTKKSTHKKTIKSLREAAASENVDVENVTIFNAYKNGQLEDLFAQSGTKFSQNENEVFIGVAGVKIVGLLAVCDSKSTSAAGDNKEFSDIEQVQKALSKAVMALHSKKSDSSPLSSIGIVYDVATKQTKCMALKEDAETQRLQKVQCELNQKPAIDCNAFQFCLYQLQIPIRLKISSKDFGDYDTILEKISNYVHSQLRADRNLISLNGELIILPEETISESLGDILLPTHECSNTLDINIFENVLQLDDEELVSSEKCAMSVELREPITVAGLLHPMNKVAWTSFLEDVKADLCDSIYCRISEVFDQTARSSRSKAVSVPLPSRTYLKCSSTSLPLFSVYSSSQAEALTEKLVLQAPKFLLLSEVQFEKDDIEVVASKNDISSDKIYIIICILVIVLSIIVGVFASISKL